VFEGEVELGDGVTIGPNCVIRNARIDSHASIRAFCHIEDATVGAESLVGPYARLRPGTTLGREVHIGNFVEIKNSAIADNSKANHLAYVGDSDVGARVNIGAGVITVNYDGVNKHRTVIEDDAFVGSDCQLIAPVTVGKSANIAAGTTLTENAPPGKLTIGRARQSVVESWKRPVKKKE
jgi:bifunctional UDP-N-acetylglucosamine pyrophosphorylase/glucosamine-1-phosphate N-acetyltransferase